MVQGAGAQIGPRPAGAERPNHHPMNTNESNLAWWIAGILLVLLIIVGYLWLSKPDLNTVLQNGHASIAAERDQIQADCQGPNMNKDACNQDLSDLASILQEFRANVNAAATTTPTAGTP